MSNRRPSVTDDSSFFDTDHNMTQPMEGIVDPVFGSLPGSNNMTTDVFHSMDRHYPMDPSLWDPRFNQQPGFFANDLPTAYLQASANLPRQTASSSSRTTSADTATRTSRTSSRSSVPSIKSPSSDGTKKNRKSKSKTSQSKQTTAAPRSQKSRSTSIPEEANESDAVDEGEDDDYEGGEGDDGSKRSQFLARNRVAASKCRKKKKKWVDNLEDTKTDLESHHSNLQMEYNGLVDEVSYMKNQLMAHSSCNDSNIDQWIKNEARRFVTNTARRYIACEAGTCNHPEHSLQGQ